MKGDCGRVCAGLVSLAHITRLISPNYDLSCVIQHITCSNYPHLPPLVHSHLHCVEVQLAGLRDSLHAVHPSVVTAYQFNIIKLINDFVLLAFTSSV